MSMRGIIKKLLPKNTLRGQLMRRMFCAISSMSIKPIRWAHQTHLSIRTYIFDIRAEKLLNPEILSGKISHVQNMADSDDAKKKYYMICWPDTMTTSVGLCAIITVHFCSIAYALAIGRIPVIDMQNYPSIYLENDRLGKENAWEYYLEQPFGCSLSSAKNGSIKKSRGPVFSGRRLVRALTGNEAGYDLCFQTWRTIYRHCFRLNKITQKHVDDEYGRLFKPGMRVLGVNCRGADYNPVMAHNHPVQPGMDVLISKVKNAMTEWECNYIFLATPEKKSFDTFNSHFPGKVLRNEAAFYDERNVDFSKRYLGSVKHERPDDAYLNGLEYLTTIVLLSRCTSAVLSQTAGSTLARYLNDGKYENVYVFNLGLY